MIQFELGANTNDLHHKQALVYGLDWKKVNTTDQFTPQV